jgi:hypothetical protein
MDNDTGGQMAPFASTAVPAPDAPDLDELIAQAECYLAAVDLFRALGHEPDWQERRP